MRRGLSVGIVAAVIAVGAAAGAEAAITFGSNLGRAPDASVCGSFLSNESCTVAIAGLGGASAAVGGATAPQAGVIVRWRIRRTGAPNQAPVQAHLRVIRGNAGAGRSEAVTLPAATGTHEFSSRLPVAAGDRLGIDLVSVPMLTTVNIVKAPGATGDLVDVWKPPLAEGTATPPVPDDIGDELALNADIEPDADGDGFGDETQDLCPTNAATQQACAAGAPDTSFTKKPKKKSKKTKQTVKFTSNVPGAIFQCSLDSVAYRECASPLKLKRLKKGKHILLVRAVAFQIPDPTPAEARFTVKKKKRKGASS
jgi:hypothetical protein